MKSISLALLFFLFVGSASGEDDVTHLDTIKTLGRGRLSDAAWTADGETLVVASANGLWLYDADDLEAEPRHISSENGWLRSMATSPNRSYIAAGFQDGTTFVWTLHEDDISSQIMSTHIIERSSPAILSLEFFEYDDFHWLATASYSIINIFHAGLEGLPSRTITLDEADAWLANFEHVTVSPDGQTIAGSGSMSYPDLRSSNALLYDMTNGATLHHQPDSDNVVFAPDNTPLFGGYNSSFGEPYEHEFCFSDAATNPTLDTIIFTVADCHDARDPAIYFWDAGIVEFTDSLLIDSVANTVAFHPNEESFVTTHADESVRVWDVSTREVIARLENFHGEVSYVAFYPDDQEIVSGSQQNVLFRWDVESGVGERLLPVPTPEAPLQYFELIPEGDAIANMQMMPDGLLLYSYEATVFLFDIDLGEVTATFAGDRNIFTYAEDNYPSVIHSPDGNWIAANTHPTIYGHQRVLYVWNVESGELTNQIDVPIHATAFDPTHDLIAYSSFSAIYLMSIPDGTIIAEFEAEHPHGNVTALAFSNDGTMLAAGYESGEIFLLGVR